jgi:hypothetical protein
MCANAQKTIVDLMGEIESTILAIGTELNIENTPQFQLVIKLYNDALTAIQNWTSGTAAQDIIEILNDLQTAVSDLPIPTTIQTLVNIILAAVATVVAILTANSPNPTPIPADANASPEETTAAYQAEVMKAAEAKVQTLAPGFKRSIWHSAASQYKTTWNNAVKGKFPDAMLLG